jgi:hypothetical protein
VTVGPGRQWSCLRWLKTSVAIFTGDLRYGRLVGSGNETGTAFTGVKDTARGVTPHDRTRRPGFQPSRE